MDFLSLALGGGVIPQDIDNKADPSFAQFSWQRLCFQQGTSVGSGQVRKLFTNKDMLGLGDLL